jgi:hypothetical protein
VVLLLRTGLADVNVAPAGTASQSTTDFGGVPERAIDGNTNGNYGALSVTHTAGSEAVPSWQVDLGQEHSLTRIVIWNRTDCCAWRLTNFRVTVLDSQGGEVESMDFFTDLSFPDTALSGFEYALAAGTTGQTVRIERLGPDSQGTLYLSLAEVEVFTEDDFPPSIVRPPRSGVAFTGGCFTFSVEAAGTVPLSYRWLKDDVEVAGATANTLNLRGLTPGDAGTYRVVVENGVGSVTSDPAELRVFSGRNLALDGLASQSTTGFGGLPALAIDGNTRGDSFTHTEVGDPAPSWEVALFGPSTMEILQIWNRTNCCPNRLHNFRILVLDSDQSEVWSDDFFTDGSFPDTTVSPFEVVLPANTMGRFVRVELLGDLIGAGFFLSLAEVVVIGDGPRPPVMSLARGDCVTASQSSEFGGGLFPAPLAINGNFDDFSHTGEGVNLPATWEVNLGAELDIAEIVLWNRTSCCGSRLRDITVSVLDLAGETRFASELLNPENALGVYPDGPQNLRLDLVELTGGSVLGGRVRIVRTPDPDLSGTLGQGNTGEPDVLSLAEVEVFAPADSPREDCANTTDDDGDLLVDCDDDDCKAAEVCQSPVFHRGDSDHNGRTELTDAVRILNFLFLGTGVLRCADAADADDNGSLELTDAVRILNFLFLGTGIIPAPGAAGTSACGPDKTPDGARELDCEEYPADSCLG